jgi:putative ABC transport system ATP-binding protein
VRALNDCSVDVDRGQLTAVMGPSGSGKSTMMHILAGLDHPTEGSVSIDGADITKLDDNELTKLRREHIGFIFQFLSLLTMVTAEENIRLPPRAGRRKDRQGVARRGDQAHRPRRPAGAPALRAFGPPAAERRHRSRARVEADPDLRGRADRQSRLATTGEILDLLSDMVADFGQTIVMVTHDARAAAIASRILFLADGCIAKELKGADQSEIVGAVDAVSRQ